MTTTYHLLTEAEPFSEFHGGAISRWAANALRNNSDSLVVCLAADETWKFPAQSVIALPRLKAYKASRRLGDRLPWLARCLTIRSMFKPIIQRLRPRDVVWIHNRPEFALALTPAIHEQKARVVLHLHNAHLAEGPLKLMRRVQVDHLVFASNFLLDQARRRFLPWLINGLIQRCRPINFLPSPGWPPSP